MLSLLLGLQSPAGARARLSVLIFHRVLPEPDPLFPGEMHAARFDAVCGWVRGWFNVLPLDEAARRLAEGTLPARAMAITFDDGYADNQQVAAPILRRHGLTATFFVATGFIDGGRMWNDTVIESIRRTTAGRIDLSDIEGLESLGALPRTRATDRRAPIEAVIGLVKYIEPAQRAVAVGGVARAGGAELPDNLMMSSQQVRDLHRQGQRIGAHTVHHPILARIAPAEARDEILRSKRTLEALLDGPVDLFAYPNGKPGQDYAPEHAELVRDLGFKAAVSTAWGAARRGDDVFQLPRCTPWDHSRWRYGARLLANLRDNLHHAR